VGAVVAYVDPVAPHATGLKGQGSSAVVAAIIAAVVVEVGDCGWEGDVPLHWGDNSHLHVSDLPLGADLPNDADHLVVFAPPHDVDHRHGGLRMSCDERTHEGECWRGGGACHPTSRGSLPKQASSQQPLLPTHEPALGQPSQGVHAHAAQPRLVQRLRRLLELELQMRYRPGQSHPGGAAGKAAGEGIRTLGMAFCYQGWVGSLVGDCCHVHMVASDLGCCRSCRW
jgi:hypothetical protein